ncbi:MAG: DUF998 domain-containing protein [Candidatus Lokiarchaeota archaeon]|nr:DUF998 domain-containing protein [Candidatus Lokiarchaeota archaeon]
MSSNHPWITSRGMRWVFWSLVFLLLLTIGLCIAFYPEPYQFFKQTISSLGEITSWPSGLPNPISQWIFTIGFSLLGIGTLFMMIGYINVKGFYCPSLKVLFLFVFFFGTVGTAFPSDHPNPTFRMYHFIGAALFVTGFGLFNFIAQLLRFIRKHVPKPADKKLKIDYYIDLIFVILVFVAIVWYLLSGLFEMLGIITPWVVLIFNLYVSQKILLIVGCIAAFLLDLDDM